MAINVSEQCKRHASAVVKIICLESALCWNQPVSCLEYCNTVGWASILTVLLGNEQSLSALKTWMLLYDQTILRFKLR